MIEILGRERFELSAHVLEAVAGRLDEVFVGTVPSKANAAVEEVNMYLCDVLAQSETFFKRATEEWSNCQQHNRRHPAVAAGSSTEPWRRGRHEPLLRRD
jgi:hypothetical protein